MTELVKEYLVVAQNASGRNMHVPLYRFKGTAPGPKVYIQSSIHGAEVQGNVVIYHLIQQLLARDICGEVVLVPNCNPVGTNIKAGEYTLGRFDPVNGTNWNRGYYFDPAFVDGFSTTVAVDEPAENIKARFRAQVHQHLQEQLESTWGLGLAQQLNLKLQQQAFDADIVIDLHNGPVSTRHIYVPEYAREAAGLFNIPHVILIPNVFAGALDEATFCPWWRLQDTLKQRYGADMDFGVEAFTLEMGSQEVISFTEGEYDAMSVLTYLSHRGVLKSGPIPPDDISRVAVLLKDYKTLFTQQGGIVEYMAAPGDYVKKGDVIAQILNVDELENPRAIDALKAPCDLIPILHFPSASVLSGTQLYKCFTHYFAL